MEKNVTFNTPDELLALVKEIYPVTEDDGFWRRTVQLTIYIFGSAICETEGPTTLQQLLDKISAAYHAGARQELKKLYSNEKISNDTINNFIQFYRNTELLLTGLTLTAVLELKKYLSK